MKCPRCGEKIDELTEVCPNCKLKLNDYDNENEEEEEDFSESKTKLLKAINWLQLALCIIASIYFFSNNQTMTGFIWIIAGIIAFAFIKGFYNIIDLLDSINDKLDK